VIDEQLDRADELIDAVLADAHRRGSIARFHLGYAYRGWVDPRARPRPVTSACPVRLEGRARWRARAPRGCATPGRSPVAGPP
jgi:hypothetical protein